MGEGGIAGTYLVYKPCRWA